MNGITQKAHQKIVTRLEEVLPGIIEELLAKETGPRDEEIANLKKMFNETQAGITEADAKAAAASASLKAETEGIRRELATALDNSAKKDTEIASLGKQLESGLAENKRLTVQLDAVTASNKELAEQAVTLSAEIEALHAKIALLNTQIPVTSGDRSEAPSPTNG